MATIAAALGRAVEAPPDPAHGRAHARGFSWERCAAEHLAFYDATSGSTSTSATSIGRPGLRVGPR